MFKKELVGVFGFPVDENPSVAMVQPAFDHHALQWQYLTIEVPPHQLGRAVIGARAMGFAGFNCTIPHKVAVMQYLDEIAPSAALIGAVNCVVRNEDQLIGENTDGRGLVRALTPVLDPKGKTVLMFGAGGAARAIAIELALAGVKKITLVNRDQRRGQALVDHLMGPEVQARAGGVQATLEAMRDAVSASPDIDIVINATSIGLYPDVTAELPLNYSSLQPNMVVVDVVPNPPETVLLKRARAAGCRTIEGLEMLVEQGRIGIELWSGVMPDAETMRAGLKTVFD